MAATRLLMVALVVLGVWSQGALAACSDDFEADLCDAEIKWEGCVDDPEADLCDVEAKVTVSGTISFTLNVANKTLVEEAAGASVASHFGVPANTVKTTATESRRLNAGDRRLAGTWSVAYEFTAATTPALTAKVAAVATTPDTFKAAFTTKFKAQLTVAGVSADVLSALVVSAVTSVSKVTPTTAFVRVTGAVTFSLAYANRAVVEVGAWKSIAEHFGVAVTLGSVTATSKAASAFSVTLGTGAQSAWSVTFDFTVPAFQAAAVEAKVAAVGSSPFAFKVYFAKAFKAYLMNVGVSATVVNALTVNTVSAIGHTTSSGYEVSSGALRSQSTSAVAFLLAALLGGVAKSYLQ